MIFFLVPLFILLILLIFSALYNIPNYLFLPSIKSDNIITTSTSYDYIEKGGKVFIVDSTNSIEEWGEVIDKKDSSLYITSPNTKKMSSFVLVRINTGNKTIIETIMKEIIK